MQLWTQEERNEGVLRLQKLLKYITLRRSSTAVELPSRTDITKLLDFSRAEATLYAAAK